MAKYYFCNSELIWGNNFSFEDYCLEGDGIVSTLSCSNEDCGAYEDFYLPFLKEEEE